MPAPSATNVTRLGLYGGPRSRYGSFAGKTAFSDSPSTVTLTESRVVAMSLTESRVVTITLTET